MERDVLIVIAIVVAAGAAVAWERREETHIRLQGIPEEQGHVLDKLAELLVQV